MTTNTSDTDQLIKDVIQIRKNISRSIGDVKCSLSELNINGSMHDLETFINSFKELESDADKMWRLLLPFDEAHKQWMEEMDASRNSFLSSVFPKEDK